MPDQTSLAVRRCAARALHLPTTSFTNVQFEASLEAGADGLILWGGGSQPYLHTQACRDELQAWIASHLGPAVCKARQAACKNSTDAAASHL